jgi:hypothetical protein
MPSIRRPVPLSLYAWLQLYAVVPLLLDIYRIFLFEYQPLLTWHDRWLIDVVLSLVVVAGYLLCALSALTGSRWTRHFYISFVVLVALGVDIAIRYGGVRFSLWTWITSLVPPALLFMPSVSIYLKTCPENRVRWPGTGNVVRILCCVFSLGSISLFMHFMLASEHLYDNLESVRRAFTLPGIVLLATLLCTCRRPGALREIGLALVASVITSILLAVDFAIRHGLNGRLLNTYVVWCWIVLIVSGAGLVAYATRRGHQPEPDA